MLDIRAKALRVDGTIKDRRGREAGGPEGGDDGVGLPMAARGVIGEAGPAGTAAIAPQQIGRDTTFIEENVVPGVVQREPGAPVAPLSADVGPPLFVGVYRFF